MKKKFNSYHNAAALRKIQSGPKKMKKKKKLLVKIN